MKATKTASGKWTCLGYYKDSHGFKHRRRFTSDFKRTAEQLATEWSVEHQHAESKKIADAKEGREDMTFREAAIRYIQNREDILSPGTVREYYRSVNHSYNLIIDRNIYDLTREEIQSLANTWAQTLSPKSIRNYHGFLSAVLKAYRPDFLLTTSFPQNIKPQLYTPTDAEVKKLLASVKNTRLEVPVLLAALSSLRRSEICALTAEDIGDGFVKVNKALVQDKNKKWVTKSTKTEDGTRTTYLPNEVTDRIHIIVPSGRVVEMNPNMLTAAFAHAVRRAGLPHFRFHALRSYYASVLHSLGIPDKYIMQWGGWHDERTLQEHYQKAMPDKVPEMAKIGIDHFQDML